MEPKEDTTLPLRPSGIREDGCEETVADGVTRGRPGLHSAKNRRLSREDPEAIGDLAGFEGAAAGYGGGEESALCVLTLPGSLAWLSRGSKLSWLDRHII